MGVPDDGEDCPFVYLEGEEPPRPVHDQIGDCALCGEPAYTACRDKIVCWACAYHLAN